MAASFAFSADAKPFTPAIFSKEKINYEEQQCSQKKEQSEEKLIKLTKATNERLCREIRQVNTKLLEERVDKRELEDKVQQLQSHIDRLNDALIDKGEKYDSLLRRFQGLNKTFGQYKEKCEREPEVWIGRCLKLDFIFKKMKQIGALPEDHGSWVWDMVEDIEFPDDSTTSIFINLPFSIRNRYLPSSDDARIDFREDEDSIIMELSREAENFNTTLSEHFRGNLDENPEIVMDHVRTIQSRFREYIRSINEKRIAAAVKIQAIWRGFSGRGIITCKGISSFDDSLKTFKLNLDKEMYSIHKVIPEDIRNRSVIINFANTSKEKIYYQWLNIKPYANTLEGKVGKEYSINPGDYVSVKVYYGHWFRFGRESDKNDYFFRIILPSLLGSMSQKSFVFDLNTKLTITSDHYIEWAKGLLGSNAVVNTSHLSVVNSYNANTQACSDCSDEEDDAMMMLAIQLSLE